jgi:DNA-directed RNA polymerase subunit M/transcription elongation factor TFIIS
MTCPKCGETMDLLEKDTSSGRDIREYKCSRCGYSDWEDRGPALWKILHDDREEAEAARADSASANSSDSHPEPAKSEQSPARSKWGRLRALLAHFHKRN